MLWCLLPCLALMKLAFWCSNRCQNKSLCIEKLSLVLPETPPYFPRQFGRCAVIGNSGDLLKTKFGEEIDTYDAVLRENGAPIQVNNEFFYLTSSSFVAMDSFIFTFVFVFGISSCRTTRNMWERKVHSDFLIEGQQKPLTKLWSWMVRSNCFLVFHFFMVIIAIVSLYVFIFVCCVFYACK